METHIYVGSTMAAGREYSCAHLFFALGLTLQQGMGSASQADGQPYQESQGVGSGRVHSDQGCRHSHLFS